MQEKKLTVNPETGKTHTAKWPTILAGGGGVLTLIAALFAQQWTGVSLKEAWPVVLFLFGIAGWGTASMARRA